MSCIPTSILQVTSKAGPSRLKFSSIPICRCFSTSIRLESGHNRWSKIRHKKGAIDKERGALFAKLSKEIINSMKSPLSPDPAFNSKLATALQRAKEQGLNKQGIENAMLRAKSVNDGTGQNVIYEAVAPGGKVVMLVECLTSNSARTVKRVKEILSKNGARTSPVLFMFNKQGLITLRPETTSREAGYDHLFEFAVEGGAEDVREIESEDGVMEYEITTSTSKLSSLTNLFSNLPHSNNYSIQSSDLVYIPIDPLKILEEGEEDKGEGINEETFESVMKIVDLLEEEGDVVKVWTNLED
ncbi:uncharacterized protein I206_105411 [Kwoniella pini CBS 10737]|uniref:Mitochondrial protein n=1 Tax=Kwoniella pini CBS 10737 TaxID=1296096 RepID=A0A1B9I4B5_9TREE|nr:mitochondrial protein [Kwoniella pini CBS 10737]OCF50362.1 mitochondrial protein [Kwoniella pini CBS 10737]